MNQWVSVSAFLTRSLRQESRFVGHHVLRAALALMILVVFATRVATQAMTGGVGALFARNVFYCSYACVTLLGGFYFSAAIVEEKEEGTLPLLRLTGASPLAILLGKSLPRLLGVLLLLLVMAPFLVLSITLGGVMPRGLITALLGMLIYAIMFSQLGLLSGVFSRNSQEAFSRTLLLWGLLEFLPLWGWCGAVSTLQLSTHASTNAVEKFVSQSSLFSAQWLEYAIGWTHLKMVWVQAVTEELPLYRNLSMYLADFRGDPLWRPQMTMHLTAAVIFLLLSRLLFEPMTARVVAEGSLSLNRMADKSRKPLRVSGDALTWKSWQWLAGGWPWFLFRLVGIPVCVWCLAIAIAWSVGQPLALWVLAASYLFVGIVVFVADFAILLERLFHTEIQQKTIGTLLLLPKTRSQLCGRMTMGVMPAIGASSTCLICGITLALYADQRAVDLSRQALASPWFYEVFALLATTLYFGLFLSVRLQQAGMLVAIMSLWFAGPILVNCLWLVLSVFFAPRSINDFLQTVFPVVLMVLQVPFCIWMHKLLIGRLEVMGTID